MSPSGAAPKPSPNGLDRKFFYSAYQTIVEHFESGDLKITFGILALVAGILAKDIAEGASLLEAIYSKENLIFIVPFFLWGTVYSAWNRYRVLHAVGSLVVLERALGVSKAGYAYWMGNRNRPWVYLLISPWPWLLLFFALGSLCGPAPHLAPYLMVAWALLLLVFARIFWEPCKGATLIEADRLPYSEEAKDFACGKASPPHQASTREAEREDKSDNDQ